MNTSSTAIGATPVPEFVTAETTWGIAYGWRCEAEGIVAYGDTKAESLSKWREAYAREYGRTYIEQEDLFAT